jgi:hypothetical protein
MQRIMTQGATHGALRLKGAVHRLWAVQRLWVDA